MSNVKTISEIRHENLLTLIDEMGSAEALAEAAGTSSVYLSQVKNRSPDSKTGKPRQIGDPMARRLESACKKPEGWMDNVHSWSAQVQTVMAVMENMTPWQLDQTVKIVAALSEPHPKAANGE
jgi:uncharacterized protein YaeQ